MLLKNAAYIGSDDRLHHQDIRIEDGRIAQISQVLQPSTHEQSIDCTSLIIIPALGDSHVHTPDTMLSGLFHGMEMSQWCNETQQGQMQQRLFDYLDESVHREAFETFVLYSYLRYMRQGIGFIVETGFADYSSEVLSRCAEICGLKAIIDWYDQLPPASTNSRIAGSIHLPEEEDLTATLIKEVCKLRKQDPRVSVMTHCLENTWRRDEIINKFGMSTVQLMHQYELLDERTLLFHCIQLTDVDRDLIKNSGATAVCCPVSSMRARESIMDLDAMINLGIPLVIGTDFLDHDIWDSMRFLHTYACSEFPHMQAPHSQVFAMATRNAARISGTTGYSGTIMEGAPADLCFLDHHHTLDPLVQTSWYSNVLYQVMQQGNSSLVRHLMVNGRFIVQNYRCTTVDEDALVKAYRRALHSLF